MIDDKREMNIGIIYIGSDKLGGILMLGKELTDSLKSKRTILFIIIMITLMCMDLYMVCERDNTVYKRENKAEIIEMDKINKEIVENSDVQMVFVSNWIMHPAKASFLSGSSEGHVAQIILLWLMPLFVLNIYSDKYISEYGRGYMNILRIKKGRHEVHILKLCASFIIPAIIYFLCLLFNFVLAQIIFYDGDNFNGLEVFKERGGFFGFMYERPNTMYFFYILMTSIVAGLCGIICQCLSFMLKKYVTVYLIGFFIWMALIMLKDGIVNMFQPFTEYGVEYILRAGSIIVVTTVIMIIITFMMRTIKRDEL